MESLKKFFNWLIKVLDGNKTIVGLFIAWLLEQPEIIVVLGSAGIWGKGIVWLFTLYFGWKHVVKKKSFSKDYK